MSFKLINLIYSYRFLSTYIFIYTIIYLYAHDFKEIQKDRLALLLITLTFIGCTYLMFIKPKYLKLKNEIIPYWLSMLFYILMHVIPFILVLKKINNKIKNKTYNSTESILPVIVIGIIYISLFNPKKIYDINLTDIIIMLCSSISIFYLIEFILIHHHPVQ
jgi:hypothetical protein